MAIVDGRVDWDSAPAWWAVAPSAASRVAWGSIAPRPRDTWSDESCPNDGNVATPVIRTVRVYGGLPIRVVSPTFLPNSARGPVASSIWSGPCSCWPEMVGGSTVPARGWIPTTGRTRPSTLSWVNENSDQALTSRWPRITRLTMAGLNDP